MKKIYSDILQFRGSHYDLGFKHGKQIKDSLIYENRLKQWRLRKPRFSIDVIETKRVFMQYAPKIWEELEGMQEAMELPMEDILRDFGGYRMQAPRSGCSVFTGKDYMIRNYDYHPKTYEGRYLIYQPNDGGYAVIGPTQRVTGRMDGMNEKGLAMGYNSIHRKKPKSGLICHMIGRILLETCANVEDAIHLLNDIPHRHSFSYILLDSNEETVIVEASPRGIDTRKSNVCTNHFEINKEENRKLLDDSYQRLEAMKNHQDDIKDGYQAFRMMNDTDKGVFSKEYKNWAGTIHTSAYFPKEKKVWFALGGDTEPITFHFEEWLQGENFRTNRVFGNIDTNLKFAHMD